MSYHWYLEFELLIQAGGLPSVKTVKLYVVLCVGTLFVGRVSQECVEHNLDETQK